MRSKKPPFEITNTILDEIAEIAELVGHVNASFGLSTNPTLRRTNPVSYTHLELRPRPPKQRALERAAALCLLIYYL